MKLKILKAKVCDIMRYNWNWCRFRIGSLMCTWLFQCVCFKRVNFVPELISVWPRERNISVSIDTSVSFLDYDYLYIFIHICILVFIYISINLLIFMFINIKILNLTKFSYKIGCNLRLQPYYISFYWRWILINPSLDYIFFLYLLCLQNF